MTPAQQQMLHAVHNGPPTCDVPVYTGTEWGIEPVAEDMCGAETVEGSTACRKHQETP